MPESLLFPATPLFDWVILPLLIFVARCTDIGLSTLRIVFVSQGRTMLAATLGFFEALIWLIVIGQILPRLDNPLYVVAYCGGFATGNVVGLALDRRLAFGTQVLRIITQRDATALVAALRAAGFGVTTVDAEGMAGPVKLVFTVVPRRQTPLVRDLVQAHNPRSFVSVEDVRQAAEGQMPRTSGRPASIRRWLGVLRKAK